MKSKIEVLNKVESVLKEANVFYEKYNNEFDILKYEIMKIIEPMTYEEAKNFFKELKIISDFKFKFHLPEEYILEEKKKKEIVYNDEIIFFKEISPLSEILSKRQLNELYYELKYSKKFRRLTLYKFGLNEDEVFKTIKFLCENNILIECLYIDCPQCEGDTIHINEELINTYKTIESLKEKKVELSVKENLKLWSLESSLEELTTYICCERKLTKDELETAINNYENYNAEFFNINRDIFKV